MQEQVVMAFDATPILDGGHVGTEHVKELFVGYAVRITQENDAHRHANHTQLGHALQRFMQMQKESLQQPQEAAATPPINPGMERDQMRRRINRRVRQLARNVYQNDYAQAYHQEIEGPFGAKFSVILNTWTVDKLRQVDDRLERRVLEVFRHG